MHYIIDHTAVHYIRLQWVTNHASQKFNKHITLINIITIDLL